MPTPITHEPASENHIITDITTEETLKNHPMTLKLLKSIGKAKIEHIKIDKP